MNFWSMLESGLDLAVAASCGSSGQGGESLHGYEGAVNLAEPMAPQLPTEPEGMSIGAKVAVGAVATMAAVGVVETGLRLRRRSLKKKAEAAAKTTAAAVAASAQTTPMAQIVAQPVAAPEGAVQPVKSA